MGFAAAFENDGTRAFDIGGLAGLCDAEFETLAPAPCPAPWSRVR
ncbi:Assimilatory nitrate reductase large subunit (EC:1.7.99.4) [Azospirillum argentinense]